MRQNRVLKIVLAVGLGVVLLLGFQLALGAGLANLMRRSLPTRTSLATRFQDSFITAEDLPFGWHRDRIGPRVKDVPGAEACLLIYYGTWDSDKTYVNVSQELILYPDSEAAANAYEGWVDRFIPPAHADKWVSPPEVEFTSQADQMVIACLPSHINGMPHHVCQAIGLYGDMVAILGGNVFDDRWLTMEDFQAVLEAMDRRIIAAAEGQG